MKAPDYAIIERHLFAPDLFGLACGSGSAGPVLDCGRGMKIRTPEPLGAFDLMLFLAVAGFCAQAWSDQLRLGINRDNFFPLDAKSTNAIDKALWRDLGMSEGFIRENGAAFRLDAGELEAIAKAAERRRSFGMVLSGNDLSRAMGQSGGGSFHERVKASIGRLSAASVLVRFPPREKRAKKGAPPPRDDMYFCALMSGAQDGRRFNFAINPLMAKALTERKGFRMVSLETLRKANDGQKILIHVLSGRLASKQEAGYDAEAIRSWLYGRARIGEYSSERLRQQRARARKCALSLDGLGLPDGRGTWLAWESKGKLHVSRPEWPHKRAAAILGRPG